MIHDACKMGFLFRAIGALITKINLKHTVRVQAQPDLCIVSQLSVLLHDPSIHPSDLQPPTSTWPRISCSIVRYYVCVCAKKAIDELPPTKEARAERGTDRTLLLCTSVWWLCGQSVAKMKT